MTTAPGDLMKRRTVLLSSLIAAALTVAPAARQAPPPPKRIVSLVPAVTEMIYALGAGDRVVGVSSFDRFPPEVERVPRVGALLDPDVERILALRPELVVVYHSQQELSKQLERARVPAFVYTHAGLEGVAATLRQLGDRLGTAERAEALAAGMSRKIEAVRARVRSAPRPRTLIVFGREALALRGIYASGGRGFVHDMVAAAGAENVFADVDREAVQATTELILARRPEVVLELRADPLDAAATAREVRVWQRLASLPAVRNGRVHILADPRTVIPGPRVAEGVELLAAVLHPGR
jgi:iron complex transport system substrate-binding protein